MLHVLAENKLRNGACVTLSYTSCCLRHLHLVPQRSKWCLIPGLTQIMRPDLHLIQSHVTRTMMMRRQKIRDSRQSENKIRSTRSTRKNCQARSCKCYSRTNDPSSCKIYFSRPDQAAAWCQALDVNLTKWVMVCKCHFKPEHFRLSSDLERPHPMPKREAVPYLRIVDHVAQATACVP
jgi:hypothetical protein